jgi:hypothetical protein
MEFGNINKYKKIIKNILKKHLKNILKKIPVCHISQTVNLLIMTFLKIIFHSGS